MVIPFTDKTAAVLALCLWCLDSDARRAGINPAPTMPTCSSVYFREDGKSDSCILSLSNSLYWLVINLIKNAAIAKVFWLGFLPATKVGNGHQL